MKLNKEIKDMNEINEYLRKLGIAHEERVSKMERDYEARLENQRKAIVTLKKYNRTPSTIIENDLRVKNDKLTRKVSHLKKKLTEANKSLEEYRDSLNGLNNNLAKSVRTNLRNLVLKLTDEKVNEHIKASFEKALTVSEDSWVMKRPIILGRYCKTNGFVLASGSKELDEHTFCTDSQCGSCAALKHQLRLQSR